MSGWVKAGKAAWGAIKGVKPGTKFKGQKSKEQIIEASRKFKSKMADEAKRAQEAEFKKKPWKKMKISKKEYDDIPF